jgi:hypothetical protein
MKTHLRYSDQTRAETDQGVIETLVRKGWEVYEPEPEPVIPPTYTANAWLEKEGYGPTQLITLLDLQGKLIAAGKASQKLNSVRAWTDGILASFVQDESPRSDWGSAPFAFSETVIDAFQQLN